MNTVPTILLIGDSHAGIWWHRPEVTRFDHWNGKLDLFTTHRFINPDDLDLWDRLTPWFSRHTTESANPSKTLIITGGEIDIRVHYWRHLPRYYKEPSDIIKYIQDDILKFYSKLVEISNKYNLEKIIVWSAPVAGERASYNSHYPFSGSSQTRNQLIHLWNREFSKIIQNDQRISLTSAFYNYIDFENYTTLNSNPSFDGVHWDHDTGPLGPVFWENFIIPATSEPIVIDKAKWNVMLDDQFDITEVESQGTYQYDTWARTSQIADLSLIDRHIEINGISYSWVKAEHRYLLPSQYVELALKKINQISVDNDAK